MSFTQPLFVPLTKGLDLSKEATLGTDDLKLALNVDYPTDGMVQGRPSRSAPKQFVVRDATAQSPTYDSAAAFSAIDYEPLGLLRHRDRSGEKAALVCEGRLFTQDGSRWVDRGPCHSTRVDRVVNYRQIAGTAPGRQITAPDFGQVASAIETPGNAAYIDFDLLNSSGAIDRRVRVAVGNAGISGATPRGSSGAQCGTTTAAVARSGDDVLHFFYRTAGGDTVTRVQLATDADAVDGAYPSICSDGTSFYVAYLTTTTDVFKVLKVGLTGTVSQTYTSGTETDLAGLWCDVLAGGNVVVAFTHGSGLTVRSLLTSNLTATGSDCDYATTACEDVVVGVVSSTVAWWACRLADATGDGDILIGTASIAGSTTTLYHRLYGGGPFTEAAINWAILHQPVVFNGRVYLTLAAASNRATTATWTTIDLTDAYGYERGSGFSLNPEHSFLRPSIVASGPVEGTYPHAQPSSAFLSSTGWSFPTTDWSRFEQNAAGGVTGLESSWGLSRISMLGPKSAQAGASTVISGSIPHHITSGQCGELGFPFLGGIPGLSADATSGGAVGTGDYGVQVCWRWTDEAGQIHRSAPSVVRTVSVPGGGNSTITATVSNPQLSTHPNMVIEVYTTDIDPTDDADHRLQATSAIDWDAAYTSIDIAVQPDMTNEILYTDGGVFAHYFVPGDGGVAVVGRRMWMAGENVAYASKLLVPGFAPSFNDEGSLQVNLPAGAGRILALESLDDKLVILCERGVYFVQDGGPENTGIGSDFIPPVRVSDLGVAGSRASTWTDQGVLFCSPLDSTDPSRGGPWLLDRQLTITDRQYLGRAALDYFTRSSSWVPEVAYSQERQQAYITTNIANGSSHGVVVLDMRVGKWAVWDMVTGTIGALQAIATVSGILWALNDEPAPFDGTPGTDSGGGDYAMVVKTAHLAGNGTSGLGWSKVRAAHALQGNGTGAHTLTMTAIQDGTRTSTSTPFVLAAPSADTTWPGTRQAPEWRLPVQKCSTLQLQLSATPATARWSAIQLDVIPLPGRSPAKNRS